MILILFFSRLFMFKWWNFSIFWQKQVKRNGANQSSNISFRHSKFLPFASLSRFTSFVLRLFFTFDVVYINCGGNTSIYATNTFHNREKDIFYGIFNLQMKVFFLYGSANFFAPSLSLGKNFKFISNFSYNHGHCFHPFPPKRMKK